MVEQQKVRVEGDRPAVRRLVIVSLELENFKSYAGIQKIGPFHKKFSAIVGPNGSGKSNVIDAMLFVFGKKAKQIRLDKLSSLIHKSDRFPNLREARVTVHLQEVVDYEDSEDEFEPIPGTELALTRYCSTDNGSRYEINKKKSSFAEVTTLLRTKGIDLDHNRFLILQGEVEQIALMKPKAPSEHEDGLLEYIEDIVGTQHYKPQIEEETAKVEKLSEEREAHVLRVQSAEKDRDSLEGAKREAEEFLQLEVRLGKQRALFIQMKVKTLSEEVNEKESEMGSVSEKLKEEKKKTEDAKSELSQMESEIREEKRRCDALVKQFDKIQEEFRKLDTGAAEHETNLKHAEAAVQKHQATLKKAQAEASKIEKQVAATEAEHKELSSELQSLRPKLEKDTAEVDRRTEDLQGKLKPLRERHVRMQQEMIPYNEEVTKAEQRVNLAETELKLYSQQDEQLSTRLEEDQRRKAEAESRLEELAATAKREKQELKQKEEQLWAEQAKLKKAEQTLPEVRNKAQQLLASVEAMKKQAQDAGSESQVQKALKRLKQQGGLDGYCGRLGDLGTIDDKYAVAVSTAAGNNLNTLVADTEATAKKILSYLKENGTGRASVVLLDQQDELFRSALKHPFKGPADRLFDKIKPSDPKYSSAFYWAVRDTLVVDNIDAATELAFKVPKGHPRPRVVTLSGELIEPTGTMTGGGRQHVPHGGGMRSQQISPTLKDDLRQQQKELEQVTNDERQLVSVIYGLKDRVQELSLRVKELQRMAKSRDGEIKHAEEARTAIDHSLQMIQKEMKVSAAKTKDSTKKQYEKEAEAARKALDAARFKRKGLDDEMHLLQNEMDKVGGPEYTRLREVVKISKSRVETLETKTSELSATIQAATKQIERARKRVDGAQKDLDKAKAKLETLRSQDTEDDGKLAEARQRLRKAREDIEGAKEKVDALEKKREKRKAELNKKKAGEVKIQHEYEAKRKELEELKQTANKLLGTLENIENAIRKSIADYGVGILDPADVDDPATFEPSKFTVLVSNDELEKLRATEVRTAIQYLEENQKKLKPNVKAIEEWQAKNTAYLRRVEDLKQVNEKRATAQAKVEALRKARHDEFMTGFKAITYKLKEMYQMLTMGGDAELELVDTFDPFSEGLQFCVRPPRKSWKHIANLSGGEKTLSSLALVFALHHFKPTPLYVMDEIDAALDFKNVSIVANYVKSAASNAQFVIISLRNNMFELANRLIGICKTENCTKSTAINPSCFVKFIPPPPAPQIKVLGPEAVKKASGGIKRPHEECEEA